MLLLLTGLAVYAWGRDRFSARVGAWAAALWLGSPLVVWLGTHAYVDVGLALFVTLGAYAFSNWTSRADGRWLILAGVCLGLAAATKYTGLFFVAAFGLAALYARRRRSSALVLVLVAAGVAAPWYVRNTLLAGDPVSPFLLPIFGDRFWSADDLVRHSGSWNDKGLGKGVLDLVLLPWNLTFRYASFDPGPRLSPLYVLAAFGLVSARLRPLLALAGAYTLVWFATAQIPRFLVPELPVLALATAAAIDLTRCRLRRLPLAHTSIATALVGAVLFAPGWVWSVKQLLEQGPLPLTAEARQAFLAAQLPSYPAYALLNQTHGSDYVLYALYDEDMHYYADGRVEGDWFGPARYPDLLTNLADGSRLYEQLRGRGAGYLLVSTRGRAVQLPSDAFFRAHFHELYAGPTTRLFEVYP